MEKEKAYQYKISMPSELQDSRKVYHVLVFKKFDISKYTRISNWINLMATVPLKFRISQSPPKPTVDSVKGSPLTSIEIDGNFRSIKDAIENSSNSVLSVGGGLTGNSYDGTTPSTFALGTPSTLNTTTTNTVTDTTHTHQVTFPVTSVNGQTGDVSVNNISGNAATATTLQTARTINGVSFNGSSNITLTANTPNFISNGAYITGTNFNGSSPTTWAVDATSSNDVNKIVARDASGNFSAGTISASLNGNAATATTLQTARTINGVSFNGSSNITLTANTSNSLSAGVGLTGSTFNGNSASTFALGTPSTLNTTTTNTVTDTTHTHQVTFPVTSVNGQTGDVSVTLSTPNPLIINDSGSGAAPGTTFDGSVARTISYNTIGAASINGVNATGTWNINISGNSNTVTNGVYLATAQTLSNKTIERAVLNKGYVEEVFTITDATSVNLDPNNGSIQTWTLGANRTPGQANWVSGQSITLLIDDGSARTITWTTLAVVWKTDGGVAPTLQTTGFTVIVLWKVGTTIYGARVGDA